MPPSTLLKVARKYEKFELEKKYRIFLKKLLPILHNMFDSESRERQFPKQEVSFLPPEKMEKDGIETKYHIHNKFFIQIEIT